MQSSLAAGCSVADDNWGKATINEVFSGLGNRTAFIEIKLLEPVDTTNWQVNICTGQNNCNDFLVSSMTNMDPWHFRENNDLNAFVDFHKGFDVSLTDAGGNIIDYITIHNKSYQPKNGCVVESLPYWFETPGDVTNGTKLIHRTQNDGTGTWSKNQPNDDGTKGADNDGGVNEPDECLVASNGIYGEAQLKIGSGVTMNGNNVSSGNTFLNSITPTGAIEDSTISLTPLGDVTFGTNNVTLNNNGALTAGSYGRVQVAKNANITMAVGDYYIDYFDVLKGARITLLGPVTLHVGKFDLDDDVEMNGPYSTGNPVTTSGDAGNLTVKWYGGGTEDNKFHIHKNVKFTGIIYSTDVGGNEGVKFHKNADFFGGIFTDNVIKMEDGGIKFTYGPKEQAAAGAVLGCDVAVFHHYEIIHDGEGSTCDTESITIKACADEACSTFINDETDVKLSINGVEDQTVTVSGGSTGTEISFSYTDVGTATLSLDQTYECKNGASGSCEVNFVDGGECDSECLDASNGIYGEAQLKIGSGVTMNGNNVSSGNTFLNSITPTGAIEDSTISLTPLGDVTFGTNNVTLNNNGALTAGSYGRVQVAKNANITMAVGDYYIDYFDVLKGAKITLLGPVTLHVGKFDLDDDVEMNGPYSTGNPVTTSGDAGNLTVKWYGGGTEDNKFHIHKNVKFTGIVYSTDVGGNEGVKFHKNADFFGGIFTDNVIKMEDGGINFTYGPKEQAAAGAVLGCNVAVIHHYEIIHDGQGLTCEAETITIKACADESCLTPHTDATDVQLSINGTFDKTVTVSDDSTGSTETSFSYTNVGTARLSLDQPYECKNGGSDSCDVVFADTGFRFFEDIETNPIPTQISAKPSSTLNIQAIKKNDDTGSCQAAFIDTRTIEMSATCVDPIACAGSQVAIKALNNITNLDTLNDGSMLTYKPVELNFGDDTQSAAEFVFTYPDAGKVQLHARYNIPDENGAPSGNFMLGSSDDFVVRPFGFYIDVVDNPKAQTAGGDIFIAAGESFVTTLKAVQWQADNDTDLSDNAVTKNFGNEEDAEIAEVIPNMVFPNLTTLPVSGVLGTLSDVIFDTFSSGDVDEKGIATNTDMTYSEVGIISIEANLKDKSYLGADDVIGSLAHVGRFIPDHFELVKTDDGDLAAYCDNEAVSVPMDFAYIGQISTASPSKGGVIRYTLNPSFTITAKSKNGVNTTVNYTGNFMKLLGSSITRLTPSIDASTDGSLSNKMALTADLNLITTADLQNSESEGIITYTYHDDDNFIYDHEKNAERNIFISDINLQIESVIDEDDVSANDADDDFDGGDPSNALDTVLTLEPTGVEIRFGRAYLANSFGPETSKLPQELSVQYFENDNYILTANDICTLYNSSNISFGANDVGIDVGDIQAVEGKFNELLDPPNGITRAIELPAPGAMNQGTVEVIYDIYDWLKYDWAYDDESIDGLYNDNPRATATFGLFRGNDRIIYQREVH